MENKGMKTYKPRFLHPDLQDYWNAKKMELENGI